jgi:hypothetical protein
LACLTAKETPAMSFNLTQSDPPATPEETGAYEDFDLRANWGERVVTGIAVALALMFVTTVAVLMGMA